MNALLLLALLGPSPVIVPPPNNTVPVGIAAYGSGTCVGADSVLYDNNGGSGCPKLTDVAPQGLMLRAQPAFPGGTQTAAQVVLCGGQDETTITIDDYTLCEDDTFTITVVNSNGTSTATILTESELGGNDWNAVTSGAQTATNMAAQLNDGTPDGVTATAASNVVRIVLDADTCIVTLAESDATCTTVATGTRGVNRAVGTRFLISDGSATEIAEFRTMSAAGALSVVTASGGTTNGLLYAEGFNAASAGSTRLAALNTTNGFYFGTSGAFILTAGTMTGNTVGYVRPAWFKLLWTNAMVAALGASLTGDIAVATLPAKYLVKRALVVITGQAAGTTTLTVSAGRVAAGYIDYVVASDAKVAANTVYGDAIGEVGTGLKDSGATALMDDLPSYTGTTLINAHFVSTVENLSSVTGSTGIVFLEVELLP